MQLNESLGIDGLVITRSARAERHACFALRYSKRASHVLLPALYRDPDPRLTGSGKCGRGISIGILTSARHC